MCIPDLMFMVRLCLRGFPYPDLEQLHFQVLQFQILAVLDSLRPFQLCLQITGKGLGCGFDSRVLAKLVQIPADPQHCVNQEWWCTPVILAGGRFKVILSHATSFTTA